MNVKPGSFLTSYFGPFTLSDCVSARVRENQTRTLLTIKSGQVCSSCSPTGKERLGLRLGVCTFQVPVVADVRYTNDVVVVIHNCI